MKDITCTTPFEDLILGSQFVPILTKLGAIKTNKDQGSSEGKVGVFQCKQCMGTFLQEREALLHYKSHVLASHEEYFIVSLGGTCPKRDCTFLENKASVIHFHCFYCSYSGCEILDLPLHMEDSHLSFYKKVSLILSDEDAQMNKIYTCGECDVSLQGKVSIVQHLLSHSTDPKVSPSDSLLKSCTMDVPVIGHKPLKFASIVNGLQCSQEISHKTKDFLTPDELKDFGLAKEMQAKEESCMKVEQDTLDASDEDTKINTKIYDRGKTNLNILKENYSVLSKGQEKMEDIEDIQENGEKQEEDPFDEYVKIEDRNDEIEKEEENGKLEDKQSENENGQEGIENKQNEMKNQENGRYQESGNVNEEIKEDKNANNVALEESKDSMFTINPLDLIFGIIEANLGSDNPMIRTRHFLLESLDNVESPSFRERVSNLGDNNRTVSGISFKEPAEPVPKMNGFDYKAYLDNSPSPGVFQCNLCNDAFKYQYFLLAHKKKVHRGNGSNSFKCCICGSAFSILADLKRHTTIKHPFNLNYFCQLCGHAFSDTKSLSKHLIKHENDTKKPDTAKDTSEPPPISRNQSEKCACDKCAEEFPSKAELNRHVVKYQGTCDPKKTGVGLRCITCGQDMPTLEALKDHRRTAHGSSASASANGTADVVPLKRGFECDYCGKTFVCRSNLRDHLVVHTGDKPYPCDICGKSFSFVNNMKTHRMTHNEGRSELCPYCGKTYKNKISLYYHVKKGACQGLSTKEVPEGYSRCPDCLLMFNEERFEAHRMKGNCRKLFRCVHCGFKCYSQVRLDTHLRRKTCMKSSTEKKRRASSDIKSKELQSVCCNRCNNFNRDCCCSFTCGICNKKIFSIGVYISHKRSHNKLDQTPTSGESASRSPEEIDSNTSSNLQCGVLKRSRRPRGSVEPVKKNRRPRRGRRKVLSRGKSIKESENVEEKMDIVEKANEIDRVTYNVSENENADSLAFKRYSTEMNVDSTTFKDSKTQSNNVQMGSINVGDSKHPSIQDINSKAGIVFPIGEALNENSEPYFDQDESLRENEDELCSTEN